MTAPLVPSEIDLRDFAFMPLDVVRLRDSDLVAVVSGEAFRAAVLLWCASWHQLPAASLPCDERILAQLAGFGRDVASWRAVSAESLRGFVECDDGRIYHPVIAEKAIEAWSMKLRQRDRTAAARAAKLSQRAPPPCDNPPMQPVTESVTETVTGSKGQGQGQGIEQQNSAPKIVDNSQVGLVASPPAPVKAKREKSTTRISVDAQPTKADLLAASHHAMPPDDVRREWQAFRAHHHAKGSQMASWSSAWVTWCLNAEKFKRPGHGPPRPYSGGKDGKAEVYLEILENERQQNDGPTGNVLGFPLIQAKFN